MSELYKRMGELVEKKDVIGIRREIENVYGYHDGETVVAALLGWDEVPADLLDAALEAFLATREVRRNEHGYWVHSLSHFTGSLWKREMYEWIKRFNEVAFRGAIDLGDSNCSDRLVGDFRSAHWSLDPADFALIPENLTWLKRSKYNAEVLDRIEHGPFTCEADYLEWQLDLPKLPRSWDSAAQADMINVDVLRKRYARLRELGRDPSRFEARLKPALEEQLAEHEAKLASAEQDWQKERAEKAIAATKAALATL
jgi:hypothetical protein